MSQAEERLAPVAAELARVGVTFTPLEWADVIAVGESAEDDDAPELPSSEVLDTPGASVPGILLTQLAGLRALHRQGVDTQVTAPAAVIGHSQGDLATQSIAGVDDVELLALARLMGAAAQLVGRRRGLLGSTMLSVSNVVPERIDAILAELPASLRVVSRLRNGRRGVVLSGPADSLRVVEARLEEVAAAEKSDRERKVTGGSPFAPVLEPLPAQLAFHHPDLAEAADLVATLGRGLRLRRCTRPYAHDALDRRPRRLGRVARVGARRRRDLDPRPRSFATSPPASPPASCAAAEPASSRRRPVAVTAS